MRALPSASNEPPATEIAFPELPTETDIYILPDGRVVIADLPAELAGMAANLGVTEACAIDPESEVNHAKPDPTA